jgi:hypothetical protein
LYRKDHAARITPVFSPVGFRGLGMHFWLLLSQAWKRFSLSKDHKWVGAEEMTELQDEINGQKAEVLYKGRNIMQLGYWNWDAWEKCSGIISTVPGNPEQFAVMTSSGEVLTIPWESVVGAWI